LLLLFSEFGLIYGNDWSVIPYKMRVNTICEVKGLVVTDVFGERTLIRAANEGDENVWQRWSMFNLSNSDDISVYNHQFFLPSTLTHTLESEPIEKINFIRDEMANMVWGIEDVIPDAAGKGINGHEAADQTGVLPPPITGSTVSSGTKTGTNSEQRAGNLFSARRDAEARRAAGRCGEGKRRFAERSTASVLHQRGRDSVCRHDSLPLLSENALV
jgi:hypothetical protein